MENENNIAKFWDEYKADFAGDILAPEIISLSKSYIGKSVLDVGAGSGALIAKIPNAIGIDLAPKNSGIIKGDISKIPFENNKFDTVFATEVIEHLPEEVLSSGLSEIRRVLKSDGVFIMTLPYKEDINLDVVVCPKCGEKFHHWGHLQSFDEEKITKILEDKGFKIIKIQPLPLGAMARHQFLKNFRWFFQKIGRFQPTNFFIVSQKWEK